MGICSIWHVSKWITAGFLFFLKMPLGWSPWLVIVCRGHSSHNHRFPSGSWSLLPNWSRCGETNSDELYSGRFVFRVQCSYVLETMWEGSQVLVPEVRLVSKDARSASLCMFSLGGRHLLRTSFFFFFILKRERWQTFLIKSWTCSNTSKFGFDLNKIQILYCMQMHNVQ